MSIASATIGLAGTASLGAYVNGKYHIASDLRQIYQALKGGKKLEQAIRANRLNPYLLFLETAAVHPHADCIWTPGRTYSWLQTQGMINRYARWFLAQNIGRNDIVVFYLQNSAEFMFSWLALLAIGAAPAMVNFNLAGKALVHCVSVAKAKMIFADGEIAERLVENEDILAMNLPIFVLSTQLQAEIEALESRELDSSITQGSNAASTLSLRYTSGTTGMPKAIRGILPSAYGVVCRMFDNMGLKTGPDGDRWYICMPMCHSTAGIVSMACMLMGITQCIGKRFSVKDFWPEVRASRSTVLVYVGEVCRYLIAAPPSPDDLKNNIRLMFGNGIRPDVWKTFRDRFGIEVIAELFGSSEGMLTMLNQARGDFLATAVGHHGALLRRRFNKMYIPVEIDYETSQVIRDPATGFARRASYNAGGEILVAVADKGTFLGYHNNPAATEQRFLHDVFEKGDFYYRSGDALRRDDDGRWYFMDRLGDTFRWKSENVSTAEVGQTLGSFDGVVDANVYGVLVPGYEGRAGCAALLLKHDGVDLQALLKHAQKDLPSYAVPVFLRIVKEASINNSHKQSKTGLREEGIDPKKVGDDVLYVLNKGAYVPFGEEQWNLLVQGKSRL